MKTINRLVIFLISVLIFFPGSSFSLEEKKVKKDDSGYVIVRFKSQEVADDWAIIARSLIDKGFAPEPMRALVPKNGSLCGVYTDLLNLPGCSKKVEELAKSLNPDIKPPGPYPGDQVLVPNLPLKPFTWGRTFEKSIQADLHEYKDFIKRWTGYVVEEIERFSRTIVKVNGWQLHIPVKEKEKVPEVVSLLNKKELKNINIIIRPLFRIKTFFSYQEPDEYFRLCRERKAPPENRASYSMLLGLPRLPDCDCEEAMRPRIVLIDTPVYKHPDIADAIIEGGIECNPEPEASAPGEKYCPTVPFSQELHHGTHMAGIMVSRDRNDSHFVGLAQDAYLHSWEWNGIVYDLDDMLFEMAYSQYPNLFVFASRFSYEKEGKDIRTEHGLLKDENVRLDHPLPARTIVDLRIPWITAVGQKENGPGIQFGLQSPMSPMNLGDQRNVIVVTACEDCNGSDARLWKNANYSEDGLVHVAAPGGKMIPGTAADGYYTQTKGTSQSAAYVGGLAAQMTACYPLYQGKPRLLKERLQVTSVPFPREEDRKKVTGGIINPKKAMLDPKIHWLTQIGERETTIESIDWQIRRMEIFDADSNGRRFVDDIRTKRILRIMKFYPSTQGRDQWIFFVRAGLGNIIKKGPGALAEDQSIVRVRFENGGEAELMLGDIEDMLVKTTSD